MLGLALVAAVGLYFLMERTRVGAMIRAGVDDMEMARELYASLGFVETAPYYYNPIPGAHYLRADLVDSPSRY